MSEAKSMKKLIRMINVIQNLLVNFLAIFLLANSSESSELSHRKTDSPNKLWLDVVFSSSLSSGQRFDAIRVVEQCWVLWL